MGETINLVNNFKIESVIFNCGELNELKKKLTKVLNQKNIKHEICINNIKIRNEFYDFIHKLGNKYSKITLQKINDSF